MREKSQPSALFSAAAPARAEAHWRPSTDIYRTPAGWLLKFDLAGVRLEDIHVEIQGCRVAVSGVRRDCTLEQGCSHYLMEISYNRFERVIELPCELAGMRVALEYREGLLFIRMEKEGS